MNKKGLTFGVVIIVLVIALAAGTGVYHMPSNRLQRQLDLGNRYLEEQNYEEAALAFERAIAIDETCVEAYLGKAADCEGMEEYETAVSLLEICHNLSGDSDYLNRIQVIKEKYDDRNEKESKQGEKVEQETEEQEDIEEQEESRGPVFEWSEEAAHRAYEVILQKYKEVTSISPEAWERNADQYVTQFPDLKRILMDDYFTPSHYDELFGGDEPCELAYSYLDIDGNGISELLLWHIHHEAEIFEIYAFNGIEAVALRLDGATEDIYYPYSVYADGTIWIYRDDSEYYRFNDDGCSVARVNLSQEDIEKTERQNILGTEIEWTIFAYDVEYVVTDDHLSEEDLHTIFEENIRSSAEICFFYDDFDGDGINEAYGITGEYSEVDELYSDVMIYYISPDGTCYCVTEYDDIYGYLTLTRDDPQRGLLDAGRYKFLLWELSANGSGSVTYVFGADRGMPFEPDISRRYMCFGMKTAYLTEDDAIMLGENTYVGYEGDFSKGYYDYLPHYFVFDEEQLQFIEN